MNFRNQSSIQIERVGLFSFVPLCVALFFAVEIFSIKTVYAARKNLLWYKGGGRSWFSMNLDLGARYKFHYSRATTISTTPELLHAEAQLSFWYQKAIGLYFFGSTTDFSSVAQSQTYGAGIKFPIISLKGKQSFINGISLQIVVDGVFYTFAPPTPPMVYATSGFGVRYGGSVVWGLFNSAIYLNTTFQIMTMSENATLSPFLGLGYQF